MTGGDLRCKAPTARRCACPTSTENRAHSAVRTHAGTARMRPIRWHGRYPHGASVQCPLPARGLGSVKTHETGHRRGDVDADTGPLARDRRPRDSFRRGFLIGTRARWRRATLDDASTQRSWSARAAASLLATTSSNSRIERSAAERSTMPRPGVMSAIRYQRTGFKAANAPASLTRPKRFTRDEVVALYHERWELELGLQRGQTRDARARRDRRRSKVPKASHRSCGRSRSHTPLSASRQSGSRPRRVFRPPHKIRGRTSIHRERSPNGGAESAGRTAQRPTDI